MNILFPMNGLGKRFQEEGYTDPKPLIKVGGIYMAVAVINSFDFAPDDQVYVAYHRKLQDFNFEDILSRGLPQLRGRLHFYCIPFNTNGAAETLIESVRHFNLFGQSVLSADCDVIYHEKVLEKFRSYSDSVVGFFVDTNPNPIYSYILSGGGVTDDVVTDIREKVKISDFACCGLYYFSADALRILSEDAQASRETAVKEVYISDLYRKFLTLGGRVLCVQIEGFDCVGTPIQLQSYCSEFQDSINGKRFCFDLDRTLVTDPVVEGDYSTVQPIPANIEFARKLKTNGGYIIIHTARRMKTHKGNVGAIIADIGLTTLKTLELFGIPHDELVFGKPYANLYIDDKAISADGDLCRSTGFYFNRLEARAKHGIDFQNGTCIKTGNLGGEEYWYNNAPKPILYKYFPKLHVNSTRKIVMDEIRDIPLSLLYVRRSLRDIVLTRLFEAMDEFHAYLPQKVDFDPNANYFAKLEKRSGHEVYKNPLAAKALTESMMFLNGLKVLPGACCLIHGDPVFSNIFCSHDYQLKFIDVRGAVGSKATIYGHRLYDYAKIYQSIVGYDYVLLNRPVDKDNVTNFKIKFNKLFLDRFSEEHLMITRGITKSLVASLLPLHKSEKVEKFLQLLSFV